MKFKKIVSILLIFITSFFLVSCNNSELDKEVKNFNVESILAEGDKVDSVSQDLVLIDKLGEVSLVYNFSDEKVITKEGKVNRQKEDVEVKLTIIFQLDKKSKEKEFKLVVKKANNEEMFEEAMSKIKNNNYNLKVSIFHYNDLVEVINASFDDDKASYKYFSGESIYVKKNNRVDHYFKKGDIWNRETIRDYKQDESLFYKSFEFEMFDYGEYITLKENNFDIINDFFETEIDNFDITSVTINFDNGEMKNILIIFNIDIEIYQMNLEFSDYGNVVIELPNIGG